MSLTITRINITELQTIRFTIDGVATEMPLDLKLIDRFLQEKVVTRQIDKSDHEAMIRFATYLQDARANRKVGIEFVLPEET